MTEGGQQTGSDKTAVHPFHVARCRSSSRTGGPAR
jgi:hypothetical protein